MDFEIQWIIFATIKIVVIQNKTVTLKPIEKIWSQRRSCVWEQDLESLPFSWQISNSFLLMNLRLFSTYPEPAIALHLPSSKQDRLPNNYAIIRDTHRARLSLWLYTIADWISSMLLPITSCEEDGSHILPLYTLSAPTHHLNLIHRKVVNRRTRI